MKASQFREPRLVRAFAFLVIGALFAVSVAAATIAQQQAAAPAFQPGVPSGPTGQGQAAILITTIAGFASLLATQLFQFYRENRNRRWDLEDRMKARAEIKKASEVQRLETIQTAIDVVRVSNINSSKLLGAIDKNTEISTDAGSKAEAAYNAANSFDARMEALQTKFEGLVTQLVEEKKKET